MFINLNKIFRKNSFDKNRSVMDLLVRQIFNANLSFLEKLAHIIRTKLINNRQKFIFSLLKNKILNKKILELGCGNGILSESLIQLESLHLTCIDISRTAVILTKERLKPYKFNQLTIINEDRF